MSDLLQFAANYDDLSTDKGYQFKFHCDKCYNGYLSRYQTSTTGVAGSLLSAPASATPTTRNTSSSRKATTPSSYLPMTCASSG